MVLDSTKHHIVYPSWVKCGLPWKGIAQLLKNAPSNPRMTRKGYDWASLGYSLSTDNFSILDGPFGNGIISQDLSVMENPTKPGGWIPGILLMTELEYRKYPGFEINRWEGYSGGSYLSPKPNDAELMGFNKLKNDPMPSFSLEPIDGLDNCALLCIGRNGAKKLDEGLVFLPAGFRGFGVKAERLDATEPGIKGCGHIQGFLDKWKLHGTWYFIDGSGLDVGLLLAMIVYLGGHLRSSIGNRIKSCHLVTTIVGHEPMCPRWNPMKLR
jgi:hypothetical protein